MKKFLAFLLAALMVFSMTACAPSMNETTAPSTTPATTPTQPSTQSTTVPANDNQNGNTQILSAIWDSYKEEDRFAAYGGAVENSVADAPGALDLSNTEEITGRYLLPEDQLANVAEAASLVHMMNNNIFTAAVFGLKDGADMQAIAEALFDNVMNNQWVCGQPDKLVLADMGGNQLLMAFGSNEAMEVFKTNMTGAYADAKILYEETIVA